MTSVRIQLFGDVAVTVGQQSVKFQTDKMRALFAYLTLAPNKPHSRESLATLLWPDFSESVALKNLRQTLNLLRKLSDICEAQGLPPLLHATRYTIQLNFDRTLHWVDVVEFDTLLKKVKSHPHRYNSKCAICHAIRQNAVDVYIGSFLENVVTDSATFAEWQTFHRQLYRHQFQLANKLIAKHALATGQFDQAIESAQQRLKIDPISDDALHNLLAGLILTNQKAKAKTVYKAFMSKLPHDVSLERRQKLDEAYQRIVNNSAEFMRNSKPTLYNQPKNGVNILSDASSTLNLRHLAPLLLDPVYRLITILSNNAAAAQHNIATSVQQMHQTSFEDGIWFINATTPAETSDNTIVSTQLEQLQQMFEPANATSHEAVTEFFVNRAALIVLSGFEKNTHTADRITRLLKTTQQLKVIFIGGAPLLLKAEHVLLLDGNRH